MGTTEEEESSRPAVSESRIIEVLTARMDEMMNVKVNTIQAGLRDTLREEIRQLIPAQQPATPAAPRGEWPKPPRREYPNQIPERRHVPSTRGSHERPEYYGDEAAEQFYQSGGSVRSNQRRPRRDYEPRPPPPPHDQFNGLKLKIPSFHGKNDPTAYLEWEQKIELVFDCHHYTDTNKVKVAVTEFYDYALSWWDQLITSRRRNGEYPVETWYEMKMVMRKRFVPSHYHRDLHQRLRLLSQGSRSVEEYYQELETLLIRASVTEDREATMSRFLGGLNRDIQNRLEMQHYVELEEMLHKAILIEQQLKRKPHIRPSYSTGPVPSKPVYSWESNPTFPRDSKPSTSKTDTDRTATVPDKGKAIDRPARNRDIRCFKCQGLGHYASECTNRKVMIIRDNGEVETEEEDQEDDTPSDEGIERPVQGKLIVARRSMSLQAKMDEHEQRENLFHTRCMVNGKICSLIIDGGSCTNVASEDMVKKLGLTVMKHPRPYPLEWLNDLGKMKVTSQVKVPFSIGKYEDEILCDVLPMDAGHILLGRPWQTDRKVIHDGFTNQHSFVFKGRKTTLIPMTPHEVYQDEMHLSKHKDQAVKGKKASFLVKVGGTDLRANPFQVGGDDVILPSMNRQDGRMDEREPVMDVLNESGMGDPKEVQVLQTVDPTDI